MNEPKTSVTQEVVRQAWVTTHAGTAAPKRHTQRIDIGDTDIGQLVAFDVAPDELDRIQFRRVARQALHGEPGALAGHIFAHRHTTVRMQAIDGP